MTTMLVIIHVVVCVFLTLVVLLQQGAKQGLGGLGGGGSSASVFGGRGANTFLQKLTAGAAAMFMVTSLLLSYLSSPRGVMDGELEDDGVQKVDTNKAENGTTTDTAPPATDKPAGEPGAAPAAAPAADAPKPAAEAPKPAADATKPAADAPK